MLMCNRMDLEKLIVDNKPVQCAKCGGKMYYVHSGRYQCQNCGYEELDDFGRIKEYLEEHGPTSALILSEATGVSIQLIDLFLKQGRIEIPEGSKYYVQCERCGCSIRYGRYCPDCVQELAGAVRMLLFENMGQRPKNESNMVGRMHFLGRG